MQKYIHYIVICKTTTAIKTILIILAIAFSLPGLAQSRARLLSEFSFKMFTGGVIGIVARLDSNERPLTFVLDTGSSGISLDSTTCSDLNLLPQQSAYTVTGIAGSKKVSYLFNKKLILPGLITDSLNFYISDYRVLSSIYGEKIDGIIGYAFLKRYIVRIDFDTLRMSVYSPGKKGYGNRGVILRPEFNFLPILMLSVNDGRKVNFPFYLDTGAGLCFLMSDKFENDSNIVSPKRKQVVTQTEGLGGKKQMRLTVIKQLKIGPYKFKHVPTYLYDDQMNITAYPITGGLLGNDIMRRFNITLNYPNREIHIAPNNQFSDDFDYAYTGLMLYDVNGGVFAEDIIANSPAAKAGLKKDDEIIAINKNFSGKIGQYINLLQKAREKTEILIRRGGLLHILTIIPESILH